MFKVTILWGATPEPGDRAITYAFGSQAELDAFWWGVTEAEGWMGYREVPAGFVVPENYDPEEDY